MHRFVIGVLMLACVAGCTPVTAPAPFVVGHVSDNTRADKAGEQAEQGIRLALYDLNKDDALAKALGGRKVEVRHTDTRGSLDAFEAQAVRLVSINRCVSLLGGWSPAETVALDQAQVPLLTFNGQPSPGASTQVFYLGMSPTSQGEVLAKFVAEDVKIERMVLLTDERRPESKTLTEAFLKTLETARKKEEAKSPAVLTLRFDKDVSWKDITERVRAHEPQAIQFAGTARDFNTWQRVYRVGGPLLIYAGDDGQSRLFELEPKTKVVLATAYVPGSDPAFHKAYQEAFHVEPDVFAAIGYDGFRILADALKRLPPLTPTDRIREDLQKELLKTKDFEGLTGKLSFSTERQLERPLFVTSWQDGTLTKIKQYP